MLAVYLGTDGAVRSCREIGFDRGEQHSSPPGAVRDGGMVEERYITLGKAVDRRGRAWFFLKPVRELASGVRLALLVDPSLKSDYVWRCGGACRNSSVRRVRS